MKNEESRDESLKLQINLEQTDWNMKESGLLKICIVKKRKIIKNEFVFTYDMR